MKHIINLGLSKIKNKTIYQKHKMSNVNHTIPYGEKYGSKILMYSQEISPFIQEKIKSGVPFFLGRFGSTELFATSTYEFELKLKQPAALEQLCRWSGFFPEEIELGEQFANIMLRSMRNIDVLGVWYTQFEDYYIKHYLSSQSVITYLSDIEPWSVLTNPWSKALEGKKVLVIHPFENTIKRQYDFKRKGIFPGCDVLPDFELKTLKAVQTIAGMKDDRFETWFDALNYMYEKAMSMDFDLAILGCGAYGFPLASMLKDAGKQAVHLGGVTQILFGIKGKRWDTEKHYQYIKDLYNESWTYPDDDETPKAAGIVENGCYWK
ncbi:hypothetical protein [Frisingicoccus sp.]|uniref:hypothetical protein n=1 Tax=Frisingicoccus sp. TaxID=1918627 RepID=UPI003AB21D3F